MVNKCKPVEKDEASTGENKPSLGSFGCLMIISVCVLAASVLIGFIMYNINNLNRLEPQKYNDVIENVPAHKWSFINGPFFQNKSLNLLREMAFNEQEALSTIVEENSVESAGEAVPVGHVDCRHPFMTLNLNRTLCHFSNRLDVGMHFVKTGGFNGYIEYFERMVARIIPFRKRLNKQLDKLDIPELNDANYLRQLKSICAEYFQTTNVDEITSEMFQFDILLMLPGQELPMHLNVAYFWGADRQTLPQWLLVAMKRSHLFDHLFIPQVQSFAFLNNPTNDDDDQNEPVEYEYVDANGVGGDFYLYPYTYNKENSNKYVILKSKANSVIMLDGSQVVHGVDRFKPDHLPPLFASHNHHYTIKYSSADSKWHLFDSSERPIATYEKNEVRLMAVWNSHCFRNEQEKLKFNSKKSQIDEIGLSQVQMAFKNELKSKDRLPSELIEPLELWTIVIKDYLKYPINLRNQYSTLFGFNYCLLHNILPSWITDSLLQNLFKNC